MSFEPRIVTFLCNWCSYEGADKAGNAHLESPANILPIKVMCSGRVEPEFVLEALREGADGVLILGCHPGDCHYKEGNYKTLRRDVLMARFLQEMGVDPRRVRLDWVSAGESERYAEVTKQMTETVRELGPFQPGELRQSAKAGA